MKKMELFALEIDETLFYNETIYYMKMPESWRNLLYFDQTGDNYKLKYQVKPLGLKLKSIFPEIISAYLDHKVIQQNKPWLISTKPIYEPYIKQLTLGWFAHLKGYSISELPQEIRDSEPEWESSKFSDVHEFVDNYQWVPGMAAVKFCQGSKFLDLGDELREELKFYHVIFNDKHECISNPIRKSHRHDPFSYVIRFALKTRGGDADRAILTVSLGTRRYLSDEQIKDGKCYMRSGHSCSVLVTVQNPYVMSPDRSFSQLKFERRPRNSSFTAWESALDELYWDVLNGESFDSDSLLANPKFYSNGDGEITAYVVNNNLFTGNSVKAGIGLPEKSGLYNLVKEFLTDCGARELQLIPDISHRGMNDNRFPIVIPKEDRLTIEIYSSPEMFDAVKKGLSTMQKSIENVTILDEISDSVFRLNSDKEFIVELVHCNPDIITSELEIDRYKDGSIAKEKRINQIVKRISKVDQPNHSVLALVEIEEKDKWRDGADPKKAIREGLKKTGRLSQFIHPLTGDEKGDLSRILNAVLDLFNDYGLFSDNVNKINASGTLLSISVIKSGKKYLPAISRLDGTDLSVKLLGNDRWMTLSEAALKMDESKFLDNPRSGNKSSEVFKAFITAEIHSELERSSGQVIVLVNAKLRNSWLGAIGNAKIKFDRAPYLNERLANEPRLRFIRINATEDVPQYRIIIDEELNRYTKAQGVFKDSLGIYYGVGGRPSAWKGIANDATKFSSPSKLLLQQRSVEYIPLGTENENESDELALLADHLRRLGLTYDKHTIFPYTMRVLSSLSKYITGNEEDYDYDAEFDEEVEEEPEEDYVKVTS